MRDSFAVWKANPDDIVQEEEYRTPRSITSEKVETVWLSAVLLNFIAHACSNLRSELNERIFVHME